MEGISTITEENSLTGNLLQFGTRFAAGHREEGSWGREKVKKKKGQKQHPVWSKNWSGNTGASIQRRIFRVQ